MSAPAFNAASDLALSVPLAGMQLIEASAGTGKTYTIAGLYVRLIVERNLSLRQILVMTFTQAATAELRGRLRERLVLCAALASSPLAEPATKLPADLGNEQLWALALLRRARAAGLAADELTQRLQAAAISMDEAAIFTIHGFCARVLGEHGAFIEGVMPGAELVPSDRDLLDDFAADFWLRAAGHAEPERLAALRVLAPTPTDLARMLNDLVAFTGEVEPAPVPLPPGADVDAAWREVQAAWGVHADAAVAVFRACFDGKHLNGNQFKPGCVEQLQSLAARLRGGQQPAARELAKFSQAKIAGAVKMHREPFAGHAAFASIDAWLEAERCADALRTALVPELLAQAVAEARAWLAQRKCALARLSYDDQIGHLHDALHAGKRGPRLAAALRAQYPCALVDEFQDTDARQFAILDTLYRDHATLFAIGDPKQAIYGFRGGDVQAYLRAAKLADARHHLERNFRSTPSLLAATEALFTARGDDAFREQGIHFQHVAWGGRAADNDLRIGADTVPALTVWPLPQGEDDKPLKADAALAALATGCASAIAGLLAPGAASLRGEPLAAGNIAVLVNKNKEAVLVLDALREKGVAAACVQKESIFATREAAALLLLLDALLAPQHLGLARGALAGDWLGRTLADFRAMADDDAVWRAALQELAELRACWLGRGMLAMLERLAERQAPRLLALADGERRMSNLLQLGDLLQAQARKHAGARPLRDWLAQAIRDADRDREDQQLRLESDAERVQIVTLHRSKGMEYDVVFLPFAAIMGGRAFKRGELARFHRGDELVQRLVLGVKETRQQAEDGDPLVGEDDALAAAADEALAEQVRLLYVGLTRARHACWLSCAGKKAALGPLGWLLPDDPYCETLTEQPAHVVTRAALPTGTAAALPASTPPTLVGARQFTRVLDRDWWLHSFSRLAAGRTLAAPEVPGAAADEISAPAAVASPPAAPEVAVRPRGARYGNAVHAILERADFAAWRDAGATPQAQTGLLQRQLRAAGYGGDDMSEAVAATEGLVIAGLNAPILPDLRLADLPAAARRAELEFHFGMAGADPARLLALLHKHGYQRPRRDFTRLHGRLRGLMNGIIDLVFTHGGQWWIVDYKTNHLGPRWADYAPERLPVAIAAHDYDLQYLIYSVALHRWLRLSLGDAYDYERHFGGVRYLFLRGMQAPGRDDNGVFADCPSAELIVALDALLHAPGEVVA